MTAVPDLNWKDGQGFILVFDVTSPSSFASLGECRERITKVTENKDVRVVSTPPSFIHKAPKTNLPLIVPMLSDWQQSGPGKQTKGVKGGGRELGEEV